MKTPPYQWSEIVRLDGAARPNSQDFFAGGLATNKSLHKPI